MLDKYKNTVRTRFARSEIKEQCVSRNSTQDKSTYVALSQVRTPTPSLPCKESIFIMIINYLLDAGSQSKPK
jgi:hypothetical protein